MGNAARCLDLSTRGEALGRTRVGESFRLRELFEMHAASAYWSFLACGRFFPRCEWRRIESLDVSKLYLSFDEWHRVILPADDDIDASDGS